jgi:hypothetical protein
VSDPVIMARLAAVEARLAALESGGGSARASGGASSAGAVASDYEMSGPKGDPLLKKHPPRWGGPPGEFVGKRFSQCSPEILDEVAGFLDWKAGKEAETPGKEKYAAYSRKDAARARGYAARLRSGWKPPPEPASSFANEGAQGGFGSSSSGFGPDTADRTSGNDDFGYGANATTDDSEIPF